MTNTATLPAPTTTRTRKGNGTWTYTVRYLRNGTVEVKSARVNRAEARHLKASLKAEGYTQVWIVRDQDGTTIR